MGCCGSKKKKKPSLNADGSPAAIEVGKKKPPGKPAQGPRNVLIVGAGFGGLGCAHALSKSSSSSTQVTMVDSKDFFTIGGVWQYVWTNRNPLEDIKWPLDKLALPGVKVMPGSTVTSFDLMKRTAQLGDGSVLPYDYMVLATGTVSDGSKIPGLSEHAIDVCDINQVERAKSELQSYIAKAKAGKGGWFSAGTSHIVLISICSVPYASPPLPFEFASLVDEELTKAGARGNTRIVISCPVPFPVGGKVPNPASESLLPLMEKKKIEWLPQHDLHDIVKNEEHLKVSFENGPHLPELEVDLMFAIYPQRAPDFLVEAGLTNAKGLIPVDLQNNRLQDDDVFVVGDVCHSMMPKPSIPHPKASEFAWQMGEAVAATICASIAGEPDPLPESRAARVVIETGANVGMEMVNDLTKVIASPAEGKPALQCTDIKFATQQKVDWANSYIEKLYGVDARKLVVAKSTGAV
jgi:sulfide:quinone oxidoreductase